MILFSHHAWVSSVGFTEAYNETVRLYEAWNAGPVEKWRVQWEDKLAVNLEG